MESNFPYFPFDCFKVAFLYTVEVAWAGLYRVDVAYATQDGGSIALAADGSPVAEGIALPSTGGYHSWAKAEEAATVRLEEGQVLLTLSVVQGGLNYAYLEFIPLP